MLYTVDQGPANGLTKNGVINNLYLELIQFFTFTRANTIMWRLHDQFNASGWQTIADNVRNYINLSKYGL